MEGYSFSAVAQGFLHKRDGLDCQDYAGSEDIPSLDAYAFAISDGHGDPACMRSSLGSRFAVEVALRHLKEFAHTWQADYNALLDSQRNNPIIRNTCESLVNTWRERVEAHLSSMPLTEEQWVSLGERGQQIAHKRPSHLYGATLVAGLVTPRMLLLLQQGDGCCVVVDQNGNLFSPMPEDERCIGNVTTSLCDADAGQRMRYYVIDLQSSPVTACFVGSDGVDKSLYGTEGLYDLCGKLALDTLGNLSQQDMEASLRLLLDELSELGCGDDASLAGFADVSRIAQIAPTLVNNRVRFVVTSELEQEKSRLNSMKRMHDRYCTIAPKSTEEEQRRDVFLAEYEGVHNHIQELEAQLRDLDATSERGQVAAPSSVSSMSSVRRIKPAAHFPKASEVTVRESIVEEHKDASIKSLEEQIPSVDDAKPTPDAQKLDEMPQPLPMPAEGVVSANHVALRAPSQRSAAMSNRLLLYVAIGFIAVVLCVGVGVLLGKSFLSDKQISVKAVAEVGTSKPEEGSSASSKAKGDSRPQDEATQIQTSALQIEALEPAVDEYVQTLVLGNEESDGLELVLGLGSTGDTNELRDYAFGNMRVEVIETESLDNVALARASITYGNLHTVLEEERRSIEDSSQMTVDSLVSHFDEGQDPKVLFVTLCMQQVADGWAVRYSAPEDIALHLLDESGYLECLQYLTGQVQDVETEEPALIYGDGE